MSEAPDPAAAMAACAEEAVATARSRFDVELDYSLESVKALDRLMDRQHRQIPQGLSRLIRKGPTDETLRIYSQLWGAYLGEVIRRLWGGEWSRPDDGIFAGLYVLTVRDNQLAPAAKAHKRLTNGAEDNVWSYLAVLHELLNPPESPT
ncbi:MAG: hypothetical protein GC160_28150 [Acidobacteria bacterium]|nr:hypothetical protein [Acidobacteriota bacterium]